MKHEGALINKYTLVSIMAIFLLTTPGYHAILLHIELPRFQVIESAALLGVAGFRTIRFQFLRSFFRNRRLRLETFDALELIKELLHSVIELDSFLVPIKSKQSDRRH